MRQSFRESEVFPLGGTLKGCTLESQAVLLIVGGSARLTFMTYYPVYERGLKFGVELRQDSPIRVRVTVSVIQVRQFLQVR